MALTAGLPAYNYNGVASMPPWLTQLLQGGGAGGAPQGPAGAPPGAPPAPQSGFPSGSPPGAAVPGLGTGLSAALPPTAMSGPVSPAFKPPPNQTQSMATSLAQLGNQPMPGDPQQGNSGAGGNPSGSGAPPSPLGNMDPSKMWGLMQAFQNQPGGASGFTPLYPGITWAG